MPTSPATATGYVDDGVWFNRLYTDLVEYVPDLVWPTSVQTYNQMRRDPQLTAILAAYTLPLRRATWTIDPTGVRPEVAQLVADDLGLPVAGADTPGAARTRGVSWREHLRMALLHLTYGHFGFEAEADVTSGQARLVTLSERMPQTILDLHVDRQGQLTGISQHQPPDTNKRRNPDVPDIPADRLVWYAHDREGAAWYGNSLLRPAFAPWLLKREMQRVFATANRRFGMGVPTGQWMPGTDPTPGQHAQLSQAVMAARVGDQSGVALPPGAFIELVGLTGSAPDTLGFMKWLDQQMSRMALAGFLDLGQTEHGSRALGQSFIDLFLLNIQSIADYVADVATREIAARIVGWNWGDTEPVPAVQVADVGSRREVTAESLQALLQSGALSSDPALEEYVRREWRLPERTAPAVTPPAVTASRPRAKRRQQSGQGSLFAAAGDEDGHPESCDDASLTSVCHCGCNGTRHGEGRAHARLGPRKAEQVANLGGNVRLAAMTDDELADTFAQLSKQGKWDAFEAVDGEMARREQGTKWLDPPKAEDHWHVGGEPTEQDRQVDVLLARGYDFVDAYAEVHGKDVDRLRSEERTSAVDRKSGERVDEAVRRGYDQWVHDQWLQAETDVRGHLLTKEAQASGVQAVDLFSGPTARARKLASEDLQRWWVDNGRLTFTQYRAQVLGRQRDRRSAELTRLGGNAKDFV